MPRTDNPFHAGNALERKIVELNAEIELLQAEIARIRGLPRLSQLDDQNKRLRAALEPFAKIEVPASAVAGTWVARTLYCNDQVTAHSVLEARKALAND